MQVRVPREDKKDLTMRYVHVECEPARFAAVHKKYLVQNTEKLLPALLLTLATRTAAWCDAH